MKGTRKLPELLSQGQLAQLAASAQRNTDKAERSRTAVQLGLRQKATRADRTNR